LDLAPDETLPSWQLRLRVTDVASDLLVPPEIFALLLKPASERAVEDKKRLDDFRLTHHPEHAALTQRLADLKKRIEETDLSVPITLIMEEMAEPRPTFVLTRGDYDKKGELVTAATPSHLPRFPSGQPTNRLGLARWLVDPSNPLTARVTVNRLWQSVFGAGLVRTTEDFGSRGELPSHPELLDWDGARIYPYGLEHETNDEAAGDERRLLSGLARAARVADLGPGESAPRPRSALPAVCRDDSRPGAGR